MQSFEAAGFWYLPATESHQVAGTLRYSPRDGLNLTLTGTLAADGTSFTSESYPIIYGFVDDSPYGKHVTLLSAFRQSIKMRMPGFATERVFANRALVGDHWLTEQELVFSAAKVGFNRLFEWANLSGAHREFTSDAGGALTGFTIRYERPEPVVIALGGVQLSLDYTWRMPKSAPNETLISEDVSFGLSSLPGLSDEDIVARYISPLRDFLTFAVDDLASIDYLILYDESRPDLGSTRTSGLHVLFQPIHYLDEDRTRHSRDRMLFKFQDVHTHFGTLLRGWMDFTTAHAVFRNMLLGVQHATGRFIDEKFLLLTQAMILFFAETATDEPAVRQVYESMKSILSGPAGHGRDEWLEASLPSMAEMQFPLHLLTATRTHTELIHPIVSGDPEGFTDKVVRTRAYLLHRDGSRPSDVLAEGDLYWAIHRLRLIAAICVLDRIGMPSEILEGCLRQNQWYRELATR